MTIECVFLLFETSLLYVNIDISALTACSWQESGIHRTHTLRKPIHMKLRCKTRAKEIDDLFAPDLFDLSLSLYLSRLIQPDDSHRYANTCNNEPSNNEPSECGRSIPLRISIGRGGQ